MKTVLAGQYFMTKDTEEFLCSTRRWKSTDPKGWIRGNAKIVPVLEVTTCCLQGKYGVEIRIEPVNKDNSHSWVSVSHGLHKLVTDLIDKEYDDNEQETSTTKTEVFAFAGRSKAKVQPSRPSTTCSSSRTTHSWKKMNWYWNRSSVRSSIPNGKKKHSSPTWRITSRRRREDQILETKRWSSEPIWVLSTLVWWCMEEQDGRRRRQQENVSILYWPVRRVRIRNSLSPSSSWSVI